MKKTRTVPCRGKAGTAWLLVQVLLGACIGAAMFIGFRSARSVQVNERGTTDALAPLRLLDRLRLAAEAAAPELQYHGTDGDSARYDLNMFGRSKEINFRVKENRNGSSWLVRSPAGKILGADTEYWQTIERKNDGSRGFRAHTGTNSKGRTFRPSAFIWLTGFIPISRKIISPELTLEFESLGMEDIKVDAGTFHATRYQIYRRLKDTRRMPFVEVWMSPEVRPLGIVMARWRGEWLRLTQLGSGSVTENDRTDEVLDPDEETLVAIVSDPKFTRKCSNCHIVEVGGYDVSVDDLNVISGKSLRFPEAIYHWRKAGMKLGQTSIGRGY